MGLGYGKVGRIVQSLRRPVVRELEIRGILLLFKTHHIKGAVLIGRLVSSFRNDGRLLGNRDHRIIRLLRSHSVVGCQHLFSGASLLMVSRTRRVPSVKVGLGLVTSRLPGLQVVTANSSSFSLGGRTNRPLIKHDARFLLSPLSLRRLTSIRDTFSAVTLASRQLICNNCPRLLSLNACERGRRCLASLASTCLLQSVLTLSKLGGTGGVRSVLHLVTCRVKRRISCSRVTGRVNLDHGAIRHCLSLLRGIFIVCGMKKFTHGLHGRVDGKYG